MRLKVLIKKRLFLCFLIFNSLFSPNILSSVLKPSKVTIDRAENYVLTIYGQSANGSGVLVILPDGNLAIITAKHVVEGMSINETAEVVIDKDNYLEVKFSNVIKVPKYDAAILLLNRKELEKSTKKFIPVSINTQSTITGQKVFVVGYPISENSIVKEPRVAEGVIQTIGKNVKSDGYSIGYSSATYVGMSGGGVFTQDGNLIAIHGRGEAIKSNDLNKTGTNFGIAINDILSFYRNKFIKPFGKENLTTASRAYLNGDFTKSYSIWKDYATRYPESFIANYNVDCLKSITQNKQINKEKYPFIYKNIDLRPFPDLEDKSSFFSIYMNDPLVKEEWKGGFPSKIISGISLEENVMGMQGNSSVQGVLRGFAQDSQYNGIMGYANKNHCSVLLTHRATIQQCKAYGIHGMPFLPDVIVSGESNNIFNIDIRP